MTTTVTVRGGREVDEGVELLQLAGPRQGQRARHGQFARAATGSRDPVGPARSTAAQVRSGIDGKQHVRT